MNATSRERDITSEIRRAAAACLRVAPARIGDTAPLTRYGLDSLNAVELAAALTQITGREVEAEALLDHPSVAALAAFVAAPVQPSPSPPLQRMLADSVLAEDIEPLEADAPGSGSLLLTGATGFLGVHLLSALLESTAEEIVCIVRAADDAAARSRVAEAAERYALPLRLSPRVRAIAGDVERPALGLAPGVYDALATETAAVIHCAAAVDWAHGYEALRGPNVCGTIETLRFASRVRRKAFHFVSSVSACYSTRGPGQVRESDTASADPSGIHLGYAQTKWVGEALVRAAAARGLDTAIYRPALIAGHADTGVANNDDVLARLVKGCIALGAAPDVAWTIDACPVDFVASALARLCGRRTTGSTIAHLTNPRVALWPEAVLWMNLRGYRLRLLPYAEWAALVEERARDRTHPLHALRGFLLKRPAGEAGRFLPELYARDHVPRVEAHATRRELSALGLECPRLGPALLHTWFDGFVRSGFLPPAPARRARPQATSLVPHLQSLLQSCYDDRRLEIVSSRRFALGEGSSILGELASWHSGAQLRLHGQHLELATAAGGRRRLDLVVKPRPEDAAAKEVACAVAALCDARLGAAFARHWARTPFAGTASREIALHTRVGGAVLECGPASFGTIELAGERALVLEHVPNVELDDAAHAHERWQRRHVEIALSGIARVHAEWLGRARELRATDWLGPVLDAAAVADTQDLWLELAEHARPRIAQWAGPGAARRLMKLALDAPARARAVDSLPHTLIHHDFNPRNVGFGVHARLCAFDWELATLGLPQRDLAELLCFVLPPDVEPASVWHYVQLHRVFIECRTGARIDPGEWRQGFRISLADFGVQRLPLYVTAHRLRARPWLERVAQSWAHLMTLSDTRVHITPLACAAA